MSFVFRGSRDLETRFSGFVEDEDYKVLLESVDVATNSGKKKTPKIKQTQHVVKDEEDDEMEEEDETTLKKEAPKLKQTQPVVKDEEDDELEEEDEAPLKKRLRRKRERESDNNLVPSLASPVSPKAIELPPSSTSSSFQSWL